MSHADHKIRLCVLNSFLNEKVNTYLAGIRQNTKRSNFMILLSFGETWMWSNRVPSSLFHWGRNQLRPHGHLDDEVILTVHKRNRHSKIEEDDPTSSSLSGPIPDALSPSICGFPGNSAPLSWWEMENYIDRAVHKRMKNILSFLYNHRVQSKNGEVQTIAIAGEITFQ